MMGNLSKMLHVTEIKEYIGKEAPIYRFIEATRISATQSKLHQIAYGIDGRDVGQAELLGLLRRSRLKDVPKLMHTDDYSLMGLVILVDSDEKTHSVEMQLEAGKGYDLKDEFHLLLNTLKVEESLTQNYLPYY